MTWLCLVYGLILCLGGQSQVVHENYGVVFLENGIIEPVHEVWHHTFAVNVSMPDFPEYDTPCNRSDGRAKRSAMITTGSRCSFDGTCNDTTFLDRLCPTITENTKRHDYLKRSVLDLYKELNGLLPDADTPRKKRGLFDFVGVAYKSLFGIATVHDTNVLHRHIRHVKDKTNQVDNILHVFESEFESYMTMQNEHNELVQEAVENNNNYINLTLLQIMKQAIRTDIVVADAINYIHLMNTHYTAVLVDIRSDLKTKLNGIHTLMRGFLPPEIVPVNILTGALHQIQQKLANNTHKTLTHENYLFYYHIRDVTYKRDKGMLYVKIKIPLTSSADIFKLYRLHTIPIILGQNRSESTQIDITDRYLAISVNGKYHTSLSTQDYSFCKGSQFMRCDSLMRMKPIREQSCMLGLFRGNATTISTLCSTSVVADRDDSVLTLRPGKYFISSNDTTWNLLCRGMEPRPVHACRHCRISVPCGCALKGSQIFIPETFIGCDSSDTPSMVHSTNLPALLEFYKQSKDALNISSRRSFASPLEVKFPKINVISHNFQDVVQKLEKSKLSLKAVAQNIKNDRQMFLTPTSKLRDDIGLGGKRPFNFGIMILSTASTVIATLALCLSLRNAKLILFIRSAKAFDFLATTPTPTEDGVKSSLGDDWPQLLELSLFLLAMTLVFGLVIGLIIFSRQVRRYQTCQQEFPLPIHTTLHVVFYGRGSYVAKELGTYCGPVGNLQVTQLKANQMSRMTRCLLCLRYNMNMDWSFLDIKYKPTSDTITLPKELHFPMINGGKTASILDDPDAMTLVGEYSQTYYEMYAWYKGADNGANLPLNTAMTPQHIYPVIPYAPPAEGGAQVPI